VFGTVPPREQSIYAVHDVALTMSTASSCEKKHYDGLEVSNTPPSRPSLQCDRGIRFVFSDCPYQASAAVVGRVE
jgi:hypothetical protein